MVLWSHLDSEVLWNLHLESIIHSSVSFQSGMHCTAVVQNHHPNYYRMLYGVGGDSCCKGRVQMEVGPGLGHRAGANGDTVGQWSSGRGGTKGEVYLE